MRRLELLLLTALGCGPLEYETLRVEFSSGQTTYTCPSGQIVTTTDVNDADTIARACLGLNGCSSSISSTDDPKCADATTNPLAGTCVDDYFACYVPRGTCTETGNGISWSEGGSIVDGRFVPPDTDEPCIFGRNDRAYFRVP